MDIAVFASGSGSNLQAIIDSCENGYIKGRVRYVVSDRKNAYALERAEKHGIETIVKKKKKSMSRKNHEQAILNKMGKVDLVALAGYMRIVTPEFLDRFYDPGLGTNRVMNIHPSILPAFKGSMQGYDDAIEYGVKLTGATVHFVTADVDGGPIILQEALYVNNNDCIKTLKMKGLELEHRLYPKAIKLFSEGRLEIHGRYVKIIGE